MIFTLPDTVLALVIYIISQPHNEAEVTRCCPLLGRARD